MKSKISLKVIMDLAMNPDGLTYKQISEKTKFHINTVSRYISYLDNKKIVDIKQEKSNSIRGRKWINIVKLKKSFIDSKNITDFFVKLSKSEQLSDSKGD